MTAALLLSAAVPTFAVPTLQLDVIGGTYDPVTQTIIGPAGEQMTLVALLTPQENASLDAINALLSDTYYISVALIPALAEASELGSFDFGGTTVNVTGDMVFGVPPIEYLEGDQGQDPHDLQTHGIFETYFSEHSFQFSAEGTADTYNSQLNPGGLKPSATGGSYYMTFDVDTSLLGGGYNLHFDLYNEIVEAQLALKKNGVQSGTDVDIQDFAPFSHDAQTNRERDAPEPGTLLLLGFGLSALGLYRRRS
jgi:hypothetical protein